MSVDITMNLLSEQDNKFKSQVGACVCLLNKGYKLTSNLLSRVYPLAAVHVALGIVKEANPDKVFEADYESMLRDVLSTGRRLAPKSYSVVRPAEFANPDLMFD